jgi:hypothetical protein
MKLKVLAFLAVLPLASCYWGHGRDDHRDDGHHDHFRGDAGYHASVGMTDSGAKTDTAGATPV